MVQHSARSDLSTSDQHRRDGGRGDRPSRRQPANTNATKALLTLSAVATIAGSVLAMSVAAYHEETPAATDQDGSQFTLPFPREALASRLFAPGRDLTPIAPQLPYVEIAQLPPPPVLEIVADTAARGPQPSTSSGATAPHGVTSGQAPAASSSISPAPAPQPVPPAQPRVVVQPRQVQQPAARTRSSR